MYPSAATRSYSSLTISRLKQAYVSVASSSRFRNMSYEQPAVLTQLKLFRSNQIAKTDFCKLFKTFIVILYSILICKIYQCGEEHID